jgi:hypothetical protein
MDRNQAWQIVCEFVKSDSLRKHMLAVEACVAAYAGQAGEDEEKWPRGPSSPWWERSPPAASIGKASNASM